MRIAFIGGRLSRRASGVKVVVERLSAALARGGHEVRVFGLADAGWHDGDASAWTGAPAEVFATQGPAALGYAPGLESAIRAFDPDLVHAHGIWMYGSAISARLARAGVANLISPHGMLAPWALTQARFKKRLAGMLFERRHLREAGCLHALNAEEAAAIRALGLKNPVAVLPNGVDLPEPGGAAQWPQWRRALPAESKVMLFFGRIHPKKNLAPLIEVWSRVAPAPWHMVIAGPDQDGHRGTLEALLAAQGVGTRVHFVGPQFGSEKDMSFAASDAFILPSLSEGLPMAVLEAWAARLPVVMSQACNLPEGFACGAASWTGTKAEEIAGALGKFFALTPEAHDEMGGKGYALVAHDYSWDVVASRFVSLYEWCCVGEPPGTAPEFVITDKGAEKV